MVWEVYIISIRCSVEGWEEMYLLKAASDGNKLQKKDIIGPSQVYIMVSGT